MPFTFYLFTRVVSLALLLVQSIPAGAANAGDPSGATAAYHFDKDSNAVYEITVKTEYPTETKSSVGYLILRPQSYDAGTQQTSLRFSWGIRVFRSEKDGRTNSWSFGSLAPMFDAPSKGTDGPTIVIDAKGQVISDGGAGNTAMLDGGQGPAWKLLLQPLPNGQSSWSAHQQLIMVREERDDSQNGFRSPFGGGHTTRVETPADETVSYTALPVKDNLLTIQRKYDLASLIKIGDVSTDHRHGDGQYVFNMQTGRIQTVDYTLTEDLAGNNVSVRLPVTVSAKLLSTDDVSKIKAEIDKQATPNQTASSGSVAKPDPNAVVTARQETLREVPDDLRATEILGATSGGGPFAMVSPGREPVIGFRIQTAEWMGRHCFRRLEPLFTKPDAPASARIVNVVARDGYVVGAVTVNAGDWLNAFCVTFMKKTDAGVDPKTSYTSPWYGEKVGDTQTKLGGDGQLIFGICGRKGLNVDSLGLVTMAPAGDASVKK